MAMSEPSARVIPAFDNHPLYTRVWLPDEEPVGVLVLAHGLAEHGGVYGELAASVVGQGFVMYAADHRGHGWTTPDMSQLGFFAAEDGWAKAVGDLGTVIAFAEKTHPGVPLFLLGHSMGSIMARCYAIENSQQLAGLALAGTIAEPGFVGMLAHALAWVVSRVCGARYRSELLRRLSFGGYNAAFRPNRTEADWLTRDETWVDAYLADPRCGFTPTAELFVNLMEGTRWAGNPDNVARVRSGLPVLICSGEADPLAVNIASVAEQYRRVGLEDVTLKLYPGARHELFHEINVKEVCADLVSWLGAHLARI